MRTTRSQADHLLFMARRIIDTHRWLVQDLIEENRSGIAPGPRRRAEFRRRAKYLRDDEASLCEGLRELAALLPAEEVRHEPPSGLRMKAARRAS